MSEDQAVSAPAVDVAADLTRLIAFLEHERERPSSCTPDIVRRFNRAIDKHLRANAEPPLDRAALGVSGEVSP